MLLRFKLKVGSLLRVYRQRQGNFDGWRRFTVWIDDAPTRRLSSLELINVHPKNSSYDIQFSQGSYSSAKLHVEPGETRSLVAVTTANPKTEVPQIRTYWVDADELKQQVQRFDRPPYIGGIRGGLTQAIGATLLFLVGGAAFTVAEITKGIAQPSVPTIAFLVLVGGSLDLAFGFISASGIRALYYYFRMPKDLRPRN